MLVLEALHLGLDSCLVLGRVPRSEWGGDTPRITVARGAGGPSGSDVGAGQGLGESLALAVGMRAGGSARPLERVQATAEALRCQCMRPAWMFWPDFHGRMARRMVLWGLVEKGNWLRFKGGLQIRQTCMDFSAPASCP